MHFLTVKTKAEDLSLLTAEERRSAAGVTGTASDTDLEAMDKRIAAAITTECSIAVGSGAEPTLRQETLVETFFGACGAQLILSRRHEVEIVSVTVDGTALTEEDYLVDPETGLLCRMQGGYPSAWSGRKVDVEYKAGFAAVPDELKAAAIAMLRLAWSERSRDPAIKSERINIPDVREVDRQYWVGALPGQTNRGAVPDAIAGCLMRFRNNVVS